MKITFLGTSAMVPTKHRNLFSILLNYKNESILVDCGEGTQRQLRIANISPTKITRILLTHHHGDHILGLIGLIHTLIKSDYNKILYIYGPEGTKSFLKVLLSLINENEKIKIEVTEILKNGTFFSNEDFSLEAKHLIHTSPCLGYVFQESNKRKINLNYTKKFGLTKHPLLGKLQKGQSIIYNNKKIDVNKATILKRGIKLTLLIDTRFDNSLINFAKDSDLLICESTYCHDLEKQALDYKHLTSKQSALIAKNSNSKKLVLTHFSQRYKDTKQLEQEAKKVFKNTIAATDLLSINI